MTVSITTNGGVVSLNGQPLPSLSRRAVWQLGPAFNQVNQGVAAAARRGGTDQAIFDVWTALGDGTRDFLAYLMLGLLTQVTVAHYRAAAPRVPEEAPAEPPKARDRMVEPRIQERTTTKGDVSYRVNLGERDGKTTWSGRLASLEDARELRDEAKEAVA